MLRLIDGTHVSIDASQIGAFEHVVPKSEEYLKKILNFFIEVLDKIPRGT
jgi:hypothetical protein